MKLVLLTLTMLISSNIIYAQQPIIQLWQNHRIPNVGYPIPQQSISPSGSIKGIEKARMLAYLPKHSNHVAILVISGGGYAHEELGHEGTPTAKWLQGLGFTVFELIYRLPREGWTSPLVPFQDGQRAIRLIRAQAHQYDYSPTKVGVLGFSAGGHLAGILATSWSTQYYPIEDKIDRLSARPDFAALIYPVISMMPPLNHTHSYKSLFNPDATLASQQALSVQMHVTEHTPPTFLAQAKDDPISSVENSILMQQALEKYHVSSDMILFSNGGHGWGLGKTGTDTTQWPDLFLTWLEQIRIL